MKTYDPNEPVIFAHIPKCAGTSFIRLLRRWFGETYHHPHVNESEEGTRLPRIQLKDKKGRWLKGIKCIHAHFDHGRGYGLPDYFPEVNQYFSFIRDPFDITVSMYFFAKGKSVKGEYFYDGKQVDIRDYYPSVEHYVKESPQWLYNHFPQDITIENYLERIPERFVYLGLFEDMQTSIEGLANVLGKTNVELPQHNKSVYDEEIPDRLRNQFYDEHKLLVAIHDFARTHYRDGLDYVSHDTGSTTHRPSGVSRLFSQWFRR